ncbi:MAG: hypothetical protein RL348_853, partial [Bacteroidota bacterium]
YIDKKDGSRSIMFEKNRFGRVGEELHYKFNNNGDIIFLEE